jgi:predicted FMN-binding regulatory protein PaiB
MNESASWTDGMDAFGGCKLYADEDGTEVSVIGRWDHVEVHCHGPIEHFREDGGCEHVDAMLVVQKPDSIPMRVLPFGGRGEAKP